MRRRLIRLHTAIEDRAVGRRGRPAMTIITPARGKIRLSPGQARRPHAAPRHRTLPAAARAVLTSFAVREVALVLFGYVAYFLVRGQTQGSHAQAVANSHKVVDLEKVAG